MEKINYLLKDGRYAVRVRKHLRAYLNAQLKGNEYINNLIEKDLKKPPKRLKWYY